MGFAGNFSSLPGAKNIGIAITEICQQQGLSLDKCRIGYWSIVTTKFGYNRRHHHGDSVLSAVLYIDTPDEGGNLIFSDTRYGAMSAPRLPHDKRVQVVEPTANQLIVFPGYLEHEVSQNLSDKERIIYSFNFIPVS